jgi:3-deoxy-D-manno-octulosonic-acid transferase
MFSFFYNGALFFLGVLALPKILWQGLILGKYRASFKERLGLKLPELCNPTRPIIWIHAVSVGETRAVIPLFKKLQAEYKEATFVISSVTETGHREAKRALEEAKAHFFLPLDFSWVIRKVIRRLKPDLLILVESDFWYHLLSEAKKAGTKIVVVNGKISERSTRRFCLFKGFAKKLFSPVDRLCVQSLEFQRRFSEVGIPMEKLCVTGNLKLDTAPVKLTPSQLSAFKEELGIRDEDRLIALGSTHAEEEELLLTALESVWQIIPTLKVIIVPRHPERFAAVAKSLKQRGLATLLYSQKEKKRGDERVILIDAMGLLQSCYQLIDVAIVGGSFIAAGGGHNIFEPVVYGVPVLFGPHMHAQSMLKELVTRARAGREVALEELADVVSDMMERSESRCAMSASADRLVEEVRGITEKTWEAIFPFIKIPKSSNLSNS